LALKRRPRLAVDCRFALINKLVGYVNTLLSFNDRRIMLLSFVISMVFIFVSGFSYYLVFLAIGCQAVSLAMMVFLITFISIVELIPVSINSLGVREGVGVYLFQLAGVPIETTLSALLIARISQTLLSATGGLRYLFPLR